MPRKKEVPGQLTLELEQEKKEPKKRSVAATQNKPSKERSASKRAKKAKVPEGYDQVVAYVESVRNTSIGNLIRVFHVGANQASVYMEQLIKDGYLLMDGRVAKKKE